MFWSKPDPVKEAERKAEADRQYNFLIGDYDPRTIRSLLNESETEALDTLRNSLETLLPDITAEEKAWCDDATLCRYLRAREYKMDKASDMLLGTLKWRREAKPTEITAKDVMIELKNDGKMYRNGYDKLGRPILWMKPGLDNTGLPEKDFKIKYLVYLLEKATALAKTRGRDKLSWVCDLKDATHVSGLGNMKISQEVLSVLQNHYPERLGVVIFFNAPFAFTLFWNMISPFVDAKTKKKVFITSSTSRLLEWIDEDNLEVAYGGKSTFKWDFDKHWDKEEKNEEESDKEQTGSQEDEELSRKSKKSSKSARSTKSKKSSSSKSSKKKKSARSESTSKKSEKSESKSKKSKSDKTTSSS